MENAIIILILAVIIGGIVWYLYRQKKQGAKCIGCPYCKQCNGSCSTKKEDA
ncbi:MAG: FeoB-associated Cys-rich membrane protein [Clostridia bacterium]|nr:FeoB-associated Cys-rich membrane protein [Clostridia bacterium]